MRKALLLVAILAMSSAAFGATYYVSTTGSDSNPGSSSQPWLTIQYAVDHIAAGDTILVMPGSYAGARLESSGTSSAPKTLAVQTADTVTLNSLSPVARHSGVLEIENYNAAVTYWVIDGFTIDGNTHAYRCFDSRSIDGQDNTNITARNLHVQHAVATGISSGHTNYALYEDNDTYSNNEHGTYCNNSSDYGIERNNLVRDNYGCGMHHNGDKSLGGDGLMSYWVVEKNIVYGSGTGGGSALNFDGMTDAKISNNLCYDNIAGGLSLYYTDSSSNSARNLFYNNTMVFQDATGRWVVNIPKGKIAPIGNKIKNNVLYTNNTSKGSVFIYTSGVSGFESNYNAVVDRFCVNGRTTITLAQWRTYGYDLNSFLSDPATLFVDPANHNFHLKSTSPAINAGTTLTEVVDDLEDYPRTAGSYDIGCYEYH